MKTLTILLAIFFLSFGLTAQESDESYHQMNLGVPSVAILDLESANGTTLNMAPSAPVEAGNPVDFANQTSSDIWLNYSSIKSTSQNPTRDISVAITSGPVPNGVEIEVQASAYSGQGEGSMGNPAGNIALSATPQVIITGIGSCYTGDGVNNGHQLTYNLALSGNAGAYAQLDADAGNAIQVTYTISDN